MSGIFATAESMIRRWGWLLAFPALAVCSSSNPTDTSNVNPPAAVSDLKVAATTDATATLSFTQVDDGTGNAASYDLRYAPAPMTWGSATSASSGSCATPVTGTGVGIRFSCTVPGLTPSTQYNFQIVAFRGALNGNPVFGALSNVAAASTAPPTPPPPMATTVTVSPSAASVVVGATSTLQAIVKDQNGTVMTGQTVQWSTNNAAAATVNSSGVVTGVAAGSATITATSSGKSGTSNITVTAVPPPDGTMLFQENFEDANLASRGWYDNTSVVLSTAEHVAGSTASAEYRFLAGATVPTSGGAQRHKFTPSNSFYVSFYVKYSANWVGSTKAYHPHEFYALSTLDGDYDGPSQNYLDVYVEQNYQNGGRPRLAIQDNKSVNYSYGALPNNLIAITEDRSVGGCNGVVEANMSSECFDFGSYWYNDKQLTGPVVFQPDPGPGYKNDWNFVEAYFQLNTIVNGVGQADGVAQYWFNGSLIIDRHDILFRTGAHPTLQFDQFLIGPYIGDGSPVDQSMFVDNLRLATSRIP